MENFEMEFFHANDSILSAQNVAYFLVLKSKFSQNMFLSVNCHLNFNRDRGDIKLYQAGLIMAAIAEIQQKYGNIESHKKIIICSRYGQEISILCHVRLCTISYDILPLRI